MKTNHILLTTTLALALSSLGCNKSGKLAQPSTSPAPTGPVEFKLKWPQGERIVQDLDMKQNLNISLPGQPNPMKQERTMGQEYGLTVVKAYQDGGHQVEMEFLSARLGVVMGGKTMLDYDSEKKVTDPKAKPVADVFSKIIGSKIEFFLNASNEVDRMQGVQELTQRLASGSQNDQLASLKGMYGEGYFKQLMSHYKILPPHPVQPGDTWPVEFEFPMAQMGIMVLDYVVTFQSWEKHGQRNCARLEFSGTIKTKPDPDASAAPGGMTISDLAGTSSGTSWFDPEIGLTIDTSMNQDMNMVINLPASQLGKRGGKMQSITNQMTQVMNIKLASVK